MTCMRVSKHWLLCSVVALGVAAFFTELATAGRAAESLAVLSRDALLAMSAVPGCAPHKRGCFEWVIVRRPDTDPLAADAWLASQGIVVGKRLHDLRLIHVWLPTGEAGVAAQRAIRAQAWVQLLTDQAVPRPGSG